MLLKLPVSDKVNGIAQDEAAETGSIITRDPKCYHSEFISSSTHRHLSTGTNNLPQPFFESNLWPSLQLSTSLLCHSTDPVIDIRPWWLMVAGSIQSELQSHASSRLGVVNAPPQQELLALLLMRHPGCVLASSRLDVRSSTP